MASETVIRPIKYNKYKPKFKNIVITYLCGEEMVSLQLSVPVKSEEKSSDHNASESDHISFCFAISLALPE